MPHLPSAVRSTRVDSAGVCVARAAAVLAGQRRREIAVRHRAQIAVHRRDGVRRLAAVHGGREHANRRVRRELLAQPDDREVRSADRRGRSRSGAPSPRSIVVSWRAVTASITPIENRPVSTPVSLARPVDLALRLRRHVASDLGARRLRGRSGASRTAGTASRRCRRLRERTVASLESTSRCS